MQASLRCAPVSARPLAPSTTTCIIPAHPFAKCSCAAHHGNAASSSGHFHLPDRSTHHASRRSLTTSRAFLSSFDTITVASQLLTTSAVAIGAWYLLNNEAGAYFEQDEMDSRRSQPCPRCDGSRYEPCVCTRWSDGDQSGCSACSKTGYMPCRSCRGGGTAVPLLVTVRKEQPGDGGNGR